ncbi:hypothetical protein B0O99DRAFT_598369 [Bisporella sp. PMI_857]|nr:hypothetical protein B0O99DRAFT_598369 [Bisporella sp. PMI_857]
MVIISAFLLALCLALQSSAATVDPKTGITFETFRATNGYTFGLAVPPTPTTDFIGQLVVPTPSAGYGGISLGGEMTNSLLIVAWTNANTIRSSFRFATTHAPPTVYTSRPSLQLSPITNGTYINSTHFSYTFLCTSCITNDSLTFSPNASTISLGWARSTNAVNNAGSATGATFQFHNVGQAIYTLNLTAAKNANYSTWATWAVKPVVLTG